MTKRLLPAALLALAVSVSGPACSSQAAAPSPTRTSSAMPTKAQWSHDTWVALRGSQGYVDRRVAQGGHKLALNLDIDNTSLATYYAPGKPVPATLALVKHAKAQGVSILFNTGRNVSLRARTIAQLKHAGYPVDGLCAHYKGETLAHSKQRCRASFVRNGFTIIANIGNRSTDFVGGNYEKAYRLPNYGNRLG